MCSRFNSPISCHPSWDKQGTADRAAPTTNCAIVLRDYGRTKRVKSDYDDEPIFFCNDKLDVLIDEFIQTVLKISLKAKSINETINKGIITFLDAYVNNIQMILIDSKNETDHQIFMMIYN
jgi:hypothetical protein